jgi:hypothetical protein
MASNRQWAAEAAMRTFSQLGLPELEIPTSRRRPDRPGSNMVGSVVPFLATCGR